jgi:glutathione peroxidase
VDGIVGQWWRCCLRTVNAGLPHWQQHSTRLARRWGTCGDNRAPATNRTEAMAAATSLYDFDAVSIAGKPAEFLAQRGKVFLIVNTASACGFTPQFAGLEKLWQDYQDRGLVVVGFPSNEFGSQDPGSNEEIASFCQMNYGVSFPMMAKTQVNGNDAHPLWQWLKGEKPGLLGTQGIKWNFTKFLVGRDGQVIKRYAPNDAPDKLRADIEKALAT